MPSAVEIEVRGLGDLQKQLDKMDPRNSRTLMGKATADAAKKVLKGPVKAKAGSLSQRLAYSVRAGAARRDKPAGIVKFDNKRAWFRHFIIGGTRPHRIRFPDQKARGVPKAQGNIRHPGTKAHPIIAEVADQYGSAALDQVERFLVRELELD